MTPSSVVGSHVLIGGISLAVDLALLVSLRGTLSLPLATALAFAGSVVVNFTLNRALHLSGEPRVLSQALRYGTLLGINAVVTVVIVSAGHRWYLAAKLAAVALTTSWNFPLYRRWVFA